MRERQLGDVCGEGAAVEYTLCGLSFDAYLSGDEPIEIEIAKAGERVTCPNCRRTLDVLRAGYKRYHFEGFKGVQS